MAYKSKVTNRNGIAKALATPMFHQRVVKDKRQDILIKTLEKDIKHHDALLKD